MPGSSWVTCLAALLQTRIQPALSLFCSLLLEAPRCLAQQAVCSLSALLPVLLQCCGEQVEEEGPQGFVLCFAFALNFGDWPGLGVKEK